MDPTAPARRAVRRLRAAARAQGAGESGLAHLIEIHGMSSAGDALVAIALAGSLFFGVSSGEARGKVALYLLFTMVPFAVLAPVVGPLLDKVRRGRRLAIAATLVGRGVLALSLARALAGPDPDPLTLYPDAFGLLILSKAYGVARSAVVPGLLPRGVGLVKANARLNLAGLLLAAAAAPVGGALAATAGPEWTLRLAAVAFFVSAAFILSLPLHVDAADEPAARRRHRFLLGPDELGPRVPAALVAAGTLRWLNGFLTVFLAFLLREEGGLGVIGSSNVALGVVIAAAGLGGVVGTGLGGRMQSRAPLALGLLAVAISVLATAFATFFYGLVALLVLGLVAGIGQAMSKLGLDSLLQRDVPDSLRGSAFSLSESVLQVAWVLGGIVGIVLPLRPGLGLGVAAAVCLAALAWCVRAGRVGKTAGARTAAAYSP